MTGRREDNSAVALINLVKAHECIWNYSIAAYSKTDVTSAAWRKIASEIKDTEKNCRERWKNIRTAYVRSLKPTKSGSRKISKKKYYLREHLEFLHPYLKGGNKFSNLHVEDTAVLECNTNKSYEGETFVEEEIHNETSPGELIETPARKRSNQTCKKEHGEVATDLIEWKKIKKSVFKCDLDADEYFLLSLLPDLKNLSLSRKRTFKREALSLLHKLLDEDELENMDYSFSVASSPSVRSSSSDHITLQTHNQSHTSNTSMTSEFKM